RPALTGIPRYQDYAARLWWGNFGLAFFGSEDELKVYTDPGLVKNNPQIAGETGWQSSFHTLGLSHDLRPAPGWLIETRASATLARVAVGLSDLSIDRRPYEWLLMSQAHWSPSEAHDVNFGLQWRQ